MFDIPNLQKMRLSNTYTDLFMYTLLWNIGLFGMGFVGLFLLLSILKYYLIRKQKLENLSRQSLLTYEINTIRESKQTENRQSQVVINESHESITEQPVNKNIPTSGLFKVINFLTSLTFYLTFILAAFIYLGFFIFGKIGRGVGFDILAMLVTAGIVIFPTIVWKKFTSTKSQNKMKREIIFTIVMLVLWLGFSIASVLMFKQVCICIFNQKYGFKIQDDWKFSSQFTRSLQIDKVCPDDKICHIFTTLPENSSDSVYFNIHSGTNIENITIQLQADASSLSTYNSNPYKMVNIQPIARRNIFAIYFTGLKPDTLYSVLVKDSKTGSILERTNYRTLPTNDSTSQLRLAVGGDIGVEDDAYKLTNNLISFQPHVIILGGDNAYDNGMRTCYYSWDNIYDMFDGLNKKLNRLVPVIFSIGNHDVGFDALATVKLNFNNPDDIPYYFLFNPQQKPNGTQAPNPQNRSSYHYHILGPTLHAHLDSGYVTQFSLQRLFLDGIVKNFPTHYKFANYHNPIYPSCTDSRNGSNDRLVIDQGLQHWTPYFDQGNFVAAFEHHTHHRKFTKKIKNNKPQEGNEGVRYVGDGSWGVPEQTCSDSHITKQKQYFQYFESQHPNHIWKIKIAKTQNNTMTIQYNAVNVDNVSVFNKTDYL